MHRQSTIDEEQTAVELRVTWQTADCHKQTRVALEAAIEALLTIPEPFSLSFTMTVGAGSQPPSACWVVSAFDTASTEAMATEVRDVLEATVSWQGFSEPADHVAPLEQSNWFVLHETEGPGRRIVNVKSVAWELAKRRSAPTTMRIDLLRNECLEDGHQGVECRILVNGEGLSSSTVASLLAADPPGRVRLAASPVADPKDAPMVLLPLAMVSHLCAGPARMPDAWPTAPETTQAEVFDRIDTAVPPHAIVFGGSGQGKTTMLEHLQAHGASRGVSRAVLCAHGDLSSRAEPIAESHDETRVVYDFGLEQCPARWNLTLTPPGMDPKSWASTLVQVLKSAFGSPNEEWFGPVGNMSLRVGCEVLVRDCLKGRPQPITRLVDVLSPSDKTEWTDALQRIGDDRLARELRNLWRMVEKDPNAHTGVWLTSKVEPFVSDPRVTAVVGSTDSEVDPSVIAAGTTVIASAPAARLGDEGSNLILGTLLAQLWHHLRARKAEAAPVDVFIDEIQRFPPRILTSLLAESRKHGVRLRLATQTPSSLDPRLCDSVLSNCGALTSFRVGTRDAHALEALYPKSTVADLARLPRHRSCSTFGDSELLTATDPPLDFGDPYRKLIP